MPRMSRAALWIEFLLLFIGVPLGYRFSPWRFPALPVLWLATLYCWWQLRRDPTFPRPLLWNPDPAVGQLPSILVCFGVVAGLVWVGMRKFVPELLWSFARTH
ncbi:MAG: hypothetical protein JOZ83_16810, partial [Silvibacterium sp.]|nr:hypothetical protein [Silvibacterium sp.]